MIIDDHQTKFQFINKIRYIELSYFIAPQSFSGGGLVFKGKLVTMERV